MKETYWGYWLVLLGVFIIGVMMLVNNISTTNTQDYYNVKEVTQAAMVDAIDFSYYRLYGNLKISEHKFVENFARRFSENLNLANTYKVEFYDLYEVPPKVSVKISTGSNAYNIANTNNNSYDAVTTLSAILELGVTGDDSGNSGKNKKTGTCPLRIKSTLQEYLSSADLHDEIKNVFGDELEVLKGKTGDEFYNEFTRWFKSKGYDRSKFKEWPKGLQMLKRQGYLIIINRAMEED